MTAGHSSPSSGFPAPYAARPLLGADDVPTEWTRRVHWLWSGGSEDSAGPGSPSHADLAWARLLGGRPPRGPGSWIAQADLGDVQVLLDVRGRVYRAGDGGCRIGVLPGSPSDAWPRLVISGGQTGADRGALEAALGLEVPVGGWAPRGYRAEDGEIPEPYRSNLREARTWRYQERTTLNVVDGDATLVVSLRDELSGGSLLTVQEARAQNRPWLHQVVPSDWRDADAWVAATIRVRSWLTSHRVGVLNVAGPRESKERGIFAATRWLVLRLLSEDPR